LLSAAFSNLLVALPEAVEMSPQRFEIASRHESGQLCLECLTSPTFWPEVVAAVNRRRVDISEQAGGFDL
jgi:hypothetical protein